MSWTSRRVGPDSERNGHADAHAHVWAPTAFPPNALQFQVQGVGVGTTGLKAEFAWGYGGSGLAQLAVAILMDRGVPPKGCRLFLPILHVALHQSAAWREIPAAHPFSGPLGRGKCPRRGKTCIRSEGLRGSQMSVRFRHRRLEVVRTPHFNRWPRRHCQGSVKRPAQMPRLSLRAVSSCGMYRLE